MVIDKKINIIKIILLISFFYYYIGLIAYSSYLLIINIGNIKFRRVELYILFAVITLFLYKIYANESSNYLYQFRYYWGFILYYLIFKNDIKINIKKLLLTLAIITIIEAIFINTFISATILPNYPNSEGESFGHFSGTGDYQKPYSFGGNPSVTGICLLTMLAITNNGFIVTLISTIAILATYSTTAYLALIFYSTIQYNIKYALLLLIGLFFTAMSSISNRISIEYIHKIIENKFMNIFVFFDSENLFLGSNKYIDYGGDFSLLSFCNSYGLIGFLIFLSLIIINTNKRNLYPLLILFIGTLHYGVIFSLPGQILFSYVLNMKKIKLNLENRVLND